MANDFEDKELDDAIGLWRESVDRQAERSDWFWARQRARVESRIISASVRRMPVFAWAGVAATLVLGATLLISGHVTPNQRIADNKPPVVHVSDHELMVSLEDTMNSGVPDSLAPASALADEMDQAFTGRVKGKENRQ